MTTPLGSPVVPEVYISVAISSGRPPDARLSTSRAVSSVAFMPRRTKSSQKIETVSSSLKSRPSFLNITIRRILPGFAFQ